jgi:hypothetical protein
MPPSSKQQALSEEEIIRKRIEEKFKQRDGFYIHLSAFIATTILLWVIWFITDTSFPWPLIPMIAWGFGIIAHGISYYNKYGGGRDKRQAIIDQQIQNEMAKRSYHKPKNDDLYEVHLTEDGELSDHFDDDPYFDDNQRYTSS